MQLWFAPDILLEGIPKDEGWPSADALQKLLRSQPFASLSTHDIESDCQRLLATGLFASVRPLLKPPGSSRIIPACIASERLLEANRILWYSAVQLPKSALLSLVACLACGLHCQAPGKMQIGMAALLCNPCADHLASLFSPPFLFRIHRCMHLSCPFANPICPDLVSPAVPLPQLYKPLFCPFPKDLHKLASWPNTQALSAHIMTHPCICSHSMCPTNAGAVGYNPRRLHSSRHDQLHCAATHRPPQSC